jgi:hypothetical protein
MTGPMFVTFPASGEASALGHAYHGSSAVVCSAHILVLRLDLHDLKQLLHPADLQVSSLVNTNIAQSVVSIGVLMLATTSLNCACLQKYAQLKCGRQ